MSYHYRTATPNKLFEYLHIKESMLKVLLIIVRQTYGWFDKVTQSHKEWDYISISFFVRKTKLSRRAIGISIQQLVDMKLIMIKNEYGRLVHTPIERKFSKKLYFKACLE